MKSCEGCVHHRKTARPMGCEGIGVDGCPDYEVVPAWMLIVGPLMGLMVLYMSVVDWIWERTFGKRRSND